MSNGKSLTIYRQQQRIKELEKALNDLLNDCINFDGAKLSDCYLKQASDALKPAN